MNQQWKAVVKHGETSPVLPWSHLACARSSLATQEFTPELKDPFAEPEREIRSRKKKKRTNTQRTPLRNLNNEMGDDQPMNEAATDDAIRLRLFPFTLTGEARAWLRSLEPSSITTWNELQNKFISRFFPPSNVEKLRSDIRTFKQREEETITEVWERFKRMLNLYPCHGLSKSWLRENCRGAHRTKDCSNAPMMTPEEVNFMNRGDFQGRWNNNRNFNQRPPGFFPQNQSQSGNENGSPSSFEEVIENFMASQAKVNEEVSLRLRNQQSTLQNIEDQVGRISQTLSGRIQGELPTQTQVNPKVDANKGVMMVDVGKAKKKSWTDIYDRVYETSGSEYDDDDLLDGVSLRFIDLGINDPKEIVLEHSEDEAKKPHKEDHKQGDYAEWVSPPKQDKRTKSNKRRRTPPTALMSCRLNMIREESRYPEIGTHIISIPRHRWKTYKTTWYCRERACSHGGFHTPTNFLIPDLPADTEVPIMFGRAFLHTAHGNIDMRNQVFSIGYGDTRMTFNPDGGPVTHLTEPYEDPALMRKPKFEEFLPHSKPKNNGAIAIRMETVEEKANASSSGNSKAHRNNKGSSSKRAKK
ncbi:hypothetical protein OSB04_019766 [Centaurea solstitialis]|uniref:Retrotransposon gag domain-containing protein n=1 Tax=Centaurea solstitialis TaxID=347529 RepID=A0AA38TAG8_9ASTR|nr:hypothetical protein OSB04_019766 [Centaurea solstitialis]